MVIAQFLKTHSWQEWKPPYFFLSTEISVVTLIPLCVQTLTFSQCTSVLCESNMIHTQTGMGCSRRINIKRGKSWEKVNLMQWCNASKQAETSGETSVGVCLHTVIHHLTLMLYWTLYRITKSIHWRAIVIQSTSFQSVLCNVWPMKREQHLL